MPAYVISDVEPRDSDLIARYRALAQDSIARYGGRYIVRGGPTTQLEGDWAPRRLVILEFASAADARAWWASPEYAEAKALRQSCSETQMVLAEGFEPPGAPRTK